MKKNKKPLTKSQRPTGNKRIRRLVGVLNTKGAMLRSLMNDKTKEREL
jgi:hypothetical protein